MNPKKIKELLATVIAQNASDLHLTVGHSPILRKNGNLIDMENFDVLTPEDTKTIILSLMTGEQQARFEKEKELDFAYSFGDKFRFRINVFMQREQAAASFRLVPFEIKTPQELNLPPVVGKFIEARQGLVLITGASSQGKSTTLACLIDGINHLRREHIITIEDPMEYVFKDDKSVIQQREVHKDTLSFAKALRAALREDPNVIMVGEMRDLETISTATTAAETGHLVFATLHTNSASQTIHRIIDVFPPHQQDQIRAQVASSLLGVVSQQLIPSTSGEFLPACEIMLATAAVSNLIRENKIHEIPAIIETSAEQGMISFNKYLTDLVSQGKVSKETAMFYSLSPDDLRSRLGGNRL